MQSFALALVCVLLVVEVGFAQPRETVSFEVDELQLHPADVARLAELRVARRRHKSTALQPPEGL